MAVKIVLSRKNEWLNRMRAYKVFVDGQQVGKISNGKVAEYDISVVNHTIECKVDWCYSNKYEITAADSDIIYLQVKSGLKGFWLVYTILILFIILSVVLPNRRQLLGQYEIWIRLVALGIPLLYFIYYLTIGRRNYLKLEKDSTNVFAS